jgi:hypothetical protein
MTAVPYLDDWAYVVVLGEHLEGRRSLFEYLFTSHNGHPSVPSRVLFLIAYYFADLRLDLLRTLTAVALIASAAALFRLVAPARGGATGARLLFFFPCLTLVVSLGHWEILSIASTVSNALALLFSILGIILTGDGLRRGDVRTLTLGGVSAFAATCSMSHGSLTWLAMAWQAAIATRPRRGLAAAFALVGVASLPVIAMLSPRTSPSLDIGLFAQAALIATGTGLIGFVNNQSVPALNLVAGGIVVGLAGGCAWTLSRMSAEARQAVNESSALIVLGWLSVLALAYGRMGFGADYLASSRYAAIAMPMTAGVYLFWLARPHPGTVLALPLTAALVLASAALTNREEARIAPHRVRAWEETTRLFRCAPPDDPAVVQRARHHYTVGRAFLVARQLSIFSEPFTCGPVAR